MEKIHWKGSPLGSKVQRLHITDALAAQLELLRGGLSGASTYLVRGLPKLCVLKVIEAESAEDVRVRGYREIHFYEQLADHLPLHTPHVLDSRIEKSGACALLLAAHEPLKPASELGAEDFTEIARELATFHAIYWNRTEQLANLSWLAKPINPDLTQDSQHAYATWLSLAQRPQFREILIERMLYTIESALLEIRTTPEYTADTPMTLCHGDCHLGNLLRSQEGHLLWADWQEVRIGYGPSDLSFLLQRAAANGTAIAQAIVVAAYCQALKAAAVENVNEQVITAAMNESERRTRLLYWPDYMNEATPEQMIYHLGRIFPV